MDESRKESILKKTKDMGKEFIVKGWHITVVLALFGLIGTISGYTYKRDVNKVDELQVTVNNKADRSYVDDKITEHEKKEAIVFKSFEDDIKETKEMVKFLYELKLKEKS